jgi:rhodanese-related sulfurtransferase
VSLQLDVDMKSGANVFKETIIFTAIAITAAFTVNFFSPSGIALFGQWDQTTGVVTAKAKNHWVNDDLEIETAARAKKIYDSGQAVFIDARTREDFQDGHIKGARSLPVGEFEAHIDTFVKQNPPETTIVTYCSGRNCMDSHDLAQLLHRHGFTQVFVFIDGYPAWDREGYPVE